jgi:hypothetical protein
MIFDPGYPYIHLHRNDFDTMANWINKYLGYGKICNNGKCEIPMDCAKVNKTIDLSLDLVDPFDNSYTLSFTREELLSANFEGETANKCTLPFFSQNLFMLNIFGNIAMKKYYTVFDATPMSGSNRIGIGLKNMVDEIGKEMIENGERELLDYQYMVAAVLVLSAIFLFIIIHYYCKSKNDEFHDLHPAMNSKSRNAVNNSMLLNDNSSSMVSRYRRGAEMGSEQAAGAGANYKLPHYQVSLIRLSDSVADPDDLSDDDSLSMGHNKIGSMQDGMITSRP